MRKFFVAFFSFCITAGLNAQTEINQGGLAFIHFNSNTGTNEGEIAFVVRQVIKSGTIFYITNRDKTQSGSGFDSPSIEQGTLRIALNEDVVPGQILKVNFTSGSTPNAISNLGILNFHGSGFDLGGGNDPDEIWVYQSASISSYTTNDENNPNTWVTGVFWNEKTTGNNIDYRPSTTLLTSANVFNLDIPGGSAKCGTWTPFLGSSSSAITALSFNDPLSSVLYNKDYWHFTTSAQINACEPQSGSINVFTTIETITTFGLVYRYSNLQWDKSTDAGLTWTLNSPPANFSSETELAELWIYQSVVLGVFDPASPQIQEFSCSKLLIKDDANNDGVTLTIPAGGVLRIGKNLSWQDGFGSSKPRIKLLSEKANSGNVYYATIAPGAASLATSGTGSYEYNYVISKPGWHHLMSPLSMTFSALNAAGGITSSGSNPFSFRTGGTQNFWFWNSADAQWTAGATNEDFSSKPYTIFIDIDEYPVTLNVVGDLAIADQNSIYNLTAGYGSPPPSGSNVPAWANTTGNSGWEFYGNPYLSFLSYDDLVRNYDDVIAPSTGSNKMAGMRGVIHVWEPDMTTSNATGRYQIRTAPTTQSGSFTGSQKAKYLSPFQAFFMQNSTSSSNTTGFVVSKKYRFATQPDASNTIMNKSQSSVEAPRGLTLYSGNIETAKFYLGIDLNSKSLQAVPHVDVPYYGDYNNPFGGLYNGKLYTIKYVPQIDDYFDQDILVQTETQGEVLMIESLSSSLDEFVLDYKTGALHPFSNGGYVFTNDTTHSGPRLKYIISNSSVGMESGEDTENKFFTAFYVKGYIVLNASLNGTFEIVNSFGQIIQTRDFISGTNTWAANNLSSGVYYIRETSTGASEKIAIP